MKTIFLVSAKDYDSCSHLVAFTTKARAGAYLKDQIRGSYATYLRAHAKRLEAGWSPKVRQSPLTYEEWLNEQHGYDLDEVEVQGSDEDETFAKTKKALEKEQARPFARVARTNAVAGPATVTPRGVR